MNPTSTSSPLAPSPNGTPICPDIRANSAAIITIGLVAVVGMAVVGLRGGQFEIGPGRLALSVP